MTDLNRRTFLTGSAALAAALAGCASTAKGVDPVTTPRATEEASGLGAEDASAPTMSDGRPALRVLLAEVDGAALDDERAKLLHARDLANDPLPQSIVMAPGRTRVELNRDEPIQLVCRLKVPKFGEVYCFADNDGHGYAKASEIEFVADAARTRARRVNEAYEKLKPTGVTLAKEFLDHLSRAQRPMANSPRNARIADAYDRLSHGLHAGEMLTLAAARHRIARLPAPRDDFQFGIKISGFNTFGPDYDKRIREAFNFATVSWYTWKNEEPPEKRIDYERMDLSIDWCVERQLTVKTFGYLYMARGATPEWIRPIETMPDGTPATGPSETTIRRFNDRWPYERIKEQYVNVVRTTAARYAGKAVPFIEIMNEAHDKANLWHLSHEQVLDMGRAVFTAAHEANPSIKRMMNHCCMWGEYAKTRNRDGTRRWSPWQFIDTCFKNGIDYERIGLQLYYPQYDVFEIERMLDRFETFNRPVHITEFATASREGLDPMSMRPNTAAPGWHGPWTPTTQADWAEAIYTLCYSKRYMECVGWWDISDAKGHFWPHGGMFDADFKPKESYHRLRTLQKRWGIGPAAKA
ncbi:MAG: endo-1,4-beta-xylanase [Tepidisphaeraceae bacterium]